MASSEALKLIGTEFLNDKMKEYQKRKVTDKDYLEFVRKLKKKKTEQISEKITNLDEKLAKMNKLMNE